MLFLSVLGAVGVDWVLSASSFSLFLVACGRAMGE